MRGRGMLIAAAGVLLAFAGAAPANAAWKPEPESYGVVTTKNVAITMQDGTVLRADVHSPSDPKTGKPADGTFPVIVTETAYGKDLGEQSGAGSSSLGSTGLGYSQYLIKRGYIQVIVDVRGTGGSQGQWEFNEPIEAQDSKRVINWAARLPHSNGKVGMLGLSYLAITQLNAAAVVGKHSPLKAIFPMAATNDIYREALTAGGIPDIEGISFYVGLTATLNLTNPAIANGSDPDALVTALLDHLGGLATFHGATSVNLLLGGDRGYDENYWQSRAPANGLKKIVDNGVAVYLVGGLYDLFQIGQPMNYAGLQNAWAGRSTSAPMGSRQKVSGRYQLLMGPWYHTTYGTGGPNLDEIQLAWFDRWLKNEPTGITRTKTPLHVVDPDGHKIEAARFPLDQAKPETEDIATGTIAFSGLSQPCSRATETWMLGFGQTALQSLGLSDYCADHELLPPSAPGQLETTTAPFTRQRVLAGPIAARIRATSTTKDAMFVVTVSDVAPDGTARTLSSGALLGSNRAVDSKRSWYSRDGTLLMPYHPYTRAAAQPVEPGAVTTYQVQLAPAFATIAAGHRIKVTIASGDSPHLLPTPPQLANLAGGVYSIEPGSSVELPLAG